MPRFQPLTVENAEGKAAELLGVVKGKFGKVPNLLGTMAHAPAALESYLKFSQALAGAHLSAVHREQIALTVAGASSCDYCAAAHTALGSSLGIDAAELHRNLDAESVDPTTRTLLEFARTMVLKRGFVSNEDVQSVRDAGFSDEDIVEVIAVVSFNLFTNYVNHVAETEVDFPVVRRHESASV